MGHPPAHREFLFIPERQPTHPDFNFRNRAATPSAQSWAAWNVAGGRPSRESEIVCAVIPPASSRVLPMRRSVRMELDAMDAGHPCALNLAAATRPFSIRTASRKMSPQTGLITSTVAVAPGKSPALCGFWKCSSVISLNIPAEYRSQRLRAPTRMGFRFISLAKFRLAKS